MDKTIFVLNGIVSVRTVIEKYGERVQEGAIKGAFRGALLVMREAVKITPVDTGNLRNSARVLKFGKGIDTKYRIIYTARYAIFVHEILTNYHRPPTQARFLVFAMRKNSKRVSRVMQQEIEANLRGL